jgi:hypothetical protein
MRPVKGPIPTNEHYDPKGTFTIARSRSDYPNNFKVFAELSQNGMIHWTSCGEVGKALVPASTTARIFHPHEHFFAAGDVHLTTTSVSKVPSLRWDRCSASL